MKVTRPKKGSNAGYSWGLYADELEGDLKNTLSNYAVLEEEVEQLRYERAQAGKRAMTLEAALEKESFYARKQKAIRLDVQAERDKLREAIDKTLNTDSSDLETLILAIGELAVSSGYFERKALVEANDG